MNIPETELIFKLIVDKGLSLNNNNVSLLQKFISHWAGQLIFSSIDYFENYIIELLIFNCKIIFQRLLRMKKFHHFCITGLKMCSSCTRRET